MTLDSNAKSKMIKLLNLTTSDQDFEALSAIRMANKMLKSKDLTWESFLSSTKTNNTNHYQQPKTNYYDSDDADDEDKIEAVLSWAEDHPNFDTEFVESLKRSYEQYGSLTDRQSSALNNIINKWRIVV